MYLRVIYFAAEKFIILGRRSVIGGKKARVPGRVWGKRWMVEIVRTNSSAVSVDRTQGLATRSEFRGRASSGIDLVRSVSFHRGGHGAPATAVGANHRLGRFSEILSSHRQEFHRISERTRGD